MATTTTVSSGTSSSITDKSDITDYFDGSSTATSSIILSGFTSTTMSLQASSGKSSTTITATGYNASITDWALPIAGKSGDVIPVTTSGGDALPAKPTPAETVDVPDWFPSHVAPPAPLATAFVVDKDPVKAPSARGRAQRRRRE